MIKGCIKLNFLINVIALDFYFGNLLVPVFTGNSQILVKIVCRSFSSKIACCAFHAYPRNSGGDKNLFPCTCVEIKTGNSRATYTLTAFDDSSSI